MPKQASANAVFGVPLEQVMEKQKEKNPELDLPRILVSLVDAVIKMNGLKTEGIFRVPAPAGEVKAVKDLLDEGNFDIITNAADVQTPCALIKLWIRELPQPLIPEQYYEACTESPGKAMDIFTQLPALNQRIIKYIISFLQQLSKPDIVEATKMNADNLSMVFAPSFLRCPFQDYGKAIAAAEKEKAFVLELFSKIDAGSLQAPPPLSPRGSAVPANPFDEEVPASPPPAALKSPRPMPVVPQNRSTIAGASRGRGLP